jgi:hypothetical protein
MNQDLQGGGRALAVVASPTGAQDATEPAARTLRDSRPAAPFVVQLLACRDGLNGYRARRRVDAPIGAAIYEATRPAMATQERVRTLALA